MQNNVQNLPGFVQDIHKSWSTSDNMDTECHEK